MANLFGVLNTARTGLFAQQAAITTTGQNVANANTEGYTRQRTILESQAIGGVLLKGTMRIKDDFVQRRLFDSNARYAGKQTLALNLGQVEAALGESQDSGLSLSMRDFFDALQALSLQPGGTTERQNIIARTEQLSTAFHAVTSQLKQVREQINRQVELEVAKVNDLTSRIAQLNGKIGSYVMQPSGAADPDMNNLLDQRDRALTELSEILPIRTVGDANSGLTVFVGDQVLIEGAHYHAMSTRVDTSNDGMAEVVLNGLGKGLSMNDKLPAGRLGALIEARDAGAGATLDEVNRLAAQLARDFNLQHRQGTGLDGSTNQDFFVAPQATAHAYSGNRGGAAASSAIILDDAQLTFHDYEIRFTAPGQYDVVDVTSGTTLSSGNAYVSGAAIDVDGIRIVISDDTGAPASGDVFRFNTYDGAGDRMGLSDAIRSDLRTIAAGESTATGDNRNALKLIELRDQPRLGVPPTHTYENYYEKVRVRQALAAATAQRAEADEAVANKQLVSMADSVSGVSLDEEATLLIQYQRAFQASSRIIALTDELLQSILQLV